MVNKGPTIQTTFNAKDKMTAPIKKMRNSMKAFAGVATAAIGAIATGRAVQALNDFASSGDDIAKTARKIGISAEALQELRFAADRSGVSAETLDGAFQKLNKNIGDLRAGTGTLTTYLNKSNPELAEQLKLVDSNEEAFGLLTDAMANADNEMDRAALAQAAFGRSGQDLIVMTENGTEGINALREEAQKYGNIISTDAAMASELYVDSLTNMKNAMMAVRNKALIPLLNKIQPFIQKIADYVSANQDLIGQKIDSVFMKLGNAVKFTMDFFQKYKGVMVSVVAVMGAYKLATLGAAAAEKIHMGMLVIGKLMQFFRIIGMITKAKGAWAAAQWALNTAMSANLIGLIVAGVAALIAVIVLLVKNWDKVKAAMSRAWEATVNFCVKAKDAVVGFASNVWNWFSKLLDNPLIAAAGVIFAPWLTIPALIIKHWQPLKDFISGIFEKITAVVDKARAIGGKIGDFFGAQGESRMDSRLYGRNDGVLSSTVTNRSQVDVNLNNLPAGSTVQRRGRAPGVNLNTAYGASGL